MAQDGVERAVLAVLLLGERHEVGGDVVGIVVVVAVLGRGKAVCQHGIVALEVGLEGFVQVFERVLLVFVHKLLDGGHGVHVGGKTAPDHAGAEVVHGAAGGHVAAVFHAAFVHDGHERLGRKVAVHALGNDRGDAGPLGDVADLLLHRGLEFFVGVKLAQVAGVRADLLAVPQRHAVVEHQFDADGPLGVGSGGPLVEAARFLRFHAAHEAVVAGVFNAHALGQHHLDMGVVKVHGGEAHAGTDDGHDLLEVFLRRGVVHAGCQRGLVNTHVAHGVHEQVGQLVGGVASFAGNAAHAHVHEGLVASKELGAALAGEPHHFRHLDQHAASEIKCLAGGHATRFDVGLVEGVHVLVNAANGHAGLVFFNHQQ